MRAKVFIIILCSLASFSFLFGYSASKDLGCDNKTQWSMPPSIEDLGYVHSSLVPFRKWLVDYFNKKKYKPILTFQQCLAVSSFLRTYAWGGKPCDKRSLFEIYKWLDNCGIMWSDPEQNSYDGCYIYDLPIMTDQNAAFVIKRYLINNPECRINTPEELRNKMNNEVIEEAKKLLSDPANLNTLDITDCEKIRNPGFWAKLRKTPLNPYKIAVAYAVSRKAIIRAEKSCNSSSLHNGKGDAFRHCYWTCMMSRRLGDPAALSYADYHEFSHDNPCDEAIMDHKNGRIGVLIGQGQSDCEKACKKDNRLSVIKEGGVCF